MNFSDRIYPAVVRDLLTLLTQGTVAEEHVVPPEGADSIVLDKRPVARVSFLAGQILVGNKPTDYRFTERDFELVGSDADPRQLTTVRFRKGGKRPAPSSTLTVNYYPVRLKPTPLNDVNVGSVVRTLVETISFELSVQYQQMQKIYDSAFVETASGSGLDNVVALVDVTRLTKGHPVGKVRFGRRAGSTGEITLPVNVVVSDGKGNRYFTSEEVTLLENQTSVEVWVHGETPRTKLLDAGQINVLERGLAGVDQVVNDEKTFLLTDDESDDQLRDRSRRAIHGTGRGTLDAIQFAVQSLPFVSAATLTEQPDGVPGTLRVDVALTEDNAFRRSQVRAQIDDFRPAGIFVDLQFAGKVRFAAVVDLTLAGNAAPASSIATLKTGIAARLGALVTGLAPGGTLRRSQALALLVQDPQVADGAVTLTADGAAVTQDNFTLAAGKVGALDGADIRFGQVKFEDAAEAGGPSMIDVDVDLAVVLTSDTAAAATAAAGGDTSALQTLARSRLEPFFGAVAAESALTFDQVLGALRDNDIFVAVPARSSAVFAQASGAFDELRDGDPPFAVPPGASLRLRGVTVALDVES